MTQRSGHDFERRKTFAVEAGALARLPDIQRSFLSGAGYGNRTRLLGLGSRCTTDVLILHMNFLIARCAIYGNTPAARPPPCPCAFSFGCAKSRDALHSGHLAMAKCLWSNPPPRLGKPMYYRCTNPADRHFKRCCYCSIPRAKMQPLFVVCEKSVRRNAVPPDFAAHFSAGFSGSGNQVNMRGLFSTLSGSMPFAAHQR